MVSIASTTVASRAASNILVKPALRQTNLSGTIRKLDDTDFGASSDLPSLSKRARVSFNPTVEEKVFEAYATRGRSLEAVRSEVKNAIEAHKRGDSEDYDVIKRIFSLESEDMDADDEADDDLRSDAELRTYVLAVSSSVQMLNRDCDGLVKALLRCNWMGRDDVFVKTYVNLLGNLASAQGYTLSLILDMLAEKLLGGNHLNTSSRQC